MGTDPKQHYVHVSHTAAPTGIDPSSRHNAQIRRTHNRIALRNAEHPKQCSLTRRAACVVRPRLLRRRDGVERGVFARVLYEVEILCVRVHRTAVA